MPRSRREFLKSSAGAMSMLATGAASDATPLAALPTRDLLPGFGTRRIRTDGATIHVRTAGSGPPLLLLHGFPQTAACWHRVAPALAKRFTVVVPDLRGYGDSSKPADGEDHAGHAKRAMLADQVAVMHALGFDRFAVVGHDRGGRVTWRLAMERPEHVSRAVILDIVPRPYDTVTRAFATAYFHWFFLIQEAPFPETLIAGAPEAFLRQFLPERGITPEAFAEYLRAMHLPGTIHAMCEDYRAGASIDERHDAETRDRRITCPLLVLWGERGVVGSLPDPLAPWRDVATDVRGAALPCGHFIPEEVPERLLQEITDFVPSVG